MKDYTKDEKEGDQSCRCPRIHKQEKTKKIGEIITELYKKWGKD